MAFEATSFTIDVIGRFVCNSFDEVINGLKSGGPPFDVVVIGAGMAGGYCAEKIYRVGKEKGANLRILVLDAGSVFLTQHEQNYPGINPSTGPEAIVTSNSGPLHPDPGVQVGVWGYPWRSNQNLAPLAYCIGGRSLFWGGWSPRLTTDHDLQPPWPDKAVAILQANYPFVEDEIGVTSERHEPLNNALKSAFITAVAGTGMTVEDSKLAVQSQPPAGNLFAFDKYSSANLLINAIREDAQRGPDPAVRSIIVMPHANVTRLPNDGTKVTGIEVFVSGQRQTLTAGNELKRDFQVVIATSTIEATRLALNSFPVNGMGSNLMVHLRDDITVTIPRSALTSAPQAPLETGTLLIRGSVPSVGGRAFHLQVLAASSLDADPDAHVFSQVPDLDLLNDLTAKQSPDTIRIVFRAVGETIGDRSVTPPDGPKDLNKKWVNLTKDPDNLEFGNVPRAWVNLPETSDDVAARTFMNQQALELAQKITGDPTKVKVEKQSNSDLGSTYHEAGALWMGAPSESLTNQDGRFHHIANAYVAGPALFPTVGSANPTLTALALARNTASVIVASFTG
jgi:choline dehydrogenase-like flavoprotein